MSLSRPTESIYPPPPAGPAVGPAPSDVSIRDYLEVLRRRRMLFIQVFVLVMAVGVVVTLLAKPVYSTQAKLLVRMQGTQINLVDAKNPFSGIMAAAQPESVATQLQLLQAPERMDEAYRRAKVTPRPGIDPPYARMENVEGTNIIAVTVEGGDPKEIAALANAILDVHVRLTDRDSEGGLDETSRLTKEQLAKAKVELDTADSKLLVFRRDHRVVQLTADQEAQAKEYVNLQAAVREADSGIVTAKAQLADLQARLQREPVDLTEETTRENPRLAKLQTRMDDLQLQRQDALLLFKEGSREMRDLDSQIANTKTLLDKEPKELKVRTHLPNPTRPALQTRVAELEASLQGLQAQYNASNARLQTKTGLVDKLGEWEVAQTRLTAEREAALSAYTSLKEAVRNLELRKSASLDSGRVIQNAGVPTVPIRPRKSTNLMLTGVLALCLAAALAFLQEYLDDRINSPDDIERTTAIPTLGHVPLMGTNQSRLVSEMPANSHIAESYRALRSSIGFAGIDAPIRRLQVTSASKGEGKTITSINLATAMAMDGKRVILVDCDMRRPSLHRVLNVPSTPGLSEVLVGTKTVEEAIQPTGVENLSVVSAGPIPPNPAELLGSRRFDQVIHDLEERCDVVVFDTPPCLPVTDPLIVAARMDGVVLVLHQGQTKKAAIRHVEGLLGRARARIVGIIFNQVKHSKGGYYYHHHYYYYGDGYYADQANRGETQRSGNGRAKLPTGAPAEAESLTRRYDPDEDA